MNTTRRLLLGSALAAAAPLSSRAQPAPIRIGVLNDQSGPYRDNTGTGSLVCAQQAVADFGDQGFAVQVISADHQNKPDVAVSIARQWFDRDGVDMVLDVPTSSVALAVAAIVREKNKVMVNSGGGTADLTGVQCTPNTVHWTYDTYMLSKSTASQLVKVGGDKWFFIVADYVFGQQLERDAAAFVVKSGGKVLGRAAYPFPETTDFSSYLLQAKASGANVIGFASAGNDTVNGVKQAHEFGLNESMKMAALLAHPTDVDAIGPELAQGLYLTGTFYWDLNDNTRAFTRKVLDRMPQKHPPNMIQAGCYAGTLHYLKAVAALGAAKAKQDGAAVVAQMKALPVQDTVFGQGRIREDGRALFPAYLFQAKAPKEIKSQWDLLKLVATTPAEEAWRPLSEGGCPLVRS
ncbi:MAG TPA: ABC transporter substrate-binding protein [Acetobacteraceae bacterium]|nr:ABC transporter substrate-binding protein [Acetobacteraceae bacterium]